MEIDGQHSGMELRRRARADEGDLDVSFEQANDGAESDEEDTPAWNCVAGRVQMRGILTYHSNRQSRRAKAKGLAESVAAAQKRSYKRTNKLKAPRKPPKSVLFGGFARLVGATDPARDTEQMDGKIAGSSWHTASSSIGLDLAVPYLPTYTGRTSGMVPLPLQTSIHKTALRLARALQSPLFTRWVRACFLYRPSDIGWFARSDWVEWLASVGMAHVRTLTRYEWSMLRRKSGFRRRFSASFVEEQRASLNSHRSVCAATHVSYGPPRTAEGPHPYAIAGPLGLGHRVTAIHPLHKGLTTGSIVSISRSAPPPYYGVFTLPYVFTIRFDRHADGVWDVQEADVFAHGDLDVMHHPLSYVPSAVHVAALSARSETGVPLLDSLSSITLSAQTKAPLGGKAYKLGAAPPPDLTLCRATHLPVIPLRLPSSWIHGVMGQVGQATDEQTSYTGTETTQPSYEMPQPSPPGAHNGAGPAGGSVQGRGARDTHKRERASFVRDSLASAPVSLGSCSLQPGAPPLLAAGQPIRVSLPEGADLVLRAFSTMKIPPACTETEWADPRSYQGEGEDEGRGQGSEDWGSGRRSSPVRNPLLLESDGLTPMMTSLLSRQLPTMWDVGSACASMPLVPLSTIGPDTASVVALAAHCGSTLATARAEAIHAAARTQVIILRKDKVLSALRFKCAQAAAAAAAGAGGHPVSAHTVNRLVLSNPGVVWLLECLRASNASLALHMRVLHRLQRLQARAAEGTDAAVVASGIAAPTRSGRDALGLGRGGSRGPFAHIDASVEGDSPFVSVALAASTALVHDPTGRGKLNKGAGAGIGMLPYRTGVDVSPGTALMLDLGSIARIDAVAARSIAKAAPVLAGAAREALIGAAGYTQLTAVPLHVKQAAGTLAARLVLPQTHTEDGTRTAQAGSAAAGSRKALQALHLALALQAQADPAGAAAAAASAGSGTSALSLGGTGLSALESFVAVQRALDALAPTYASNRQLYDDVCATVASLRAAIAAV